MCSHNALSVTAYDEGFDLTGSSSAKPCFPLQDVSYNLNNGLIVLTFEKSKDWKNRGFSERTNEREFKKICKKEIYFAETYKQNASGKIIKSNNSKIRNVEGTEGQNVINDAFKISVTPDTKYIQVHMSGFRGKISKRLFSIASISKIAIGSKSDWKNKWKETESKLKEKISSDKIKPRIKLFGLENNLRVDTYNFFVRGVATDDEGVLSVFINGKKSSIKQDGSFASKVKLGIGANKIKIQVEDLNGNISEQVVTIIREEYISDQNFADVDIPPKTGMNKPNALAVVVGIENYQYVPDATYAYNDAEVFREYLAQTLGFKKQRIKLVTNSKATQAELNKLLGPNGWLSRNIVSGKSDVVFYFSGHGISNLKNQTNNILPFDVDPNYSVGLSLKNLYQNLASFEAKSVTVFLDACFTGQTRDAKMLIPDARPMLIPAKEIKLSQNINILSAASSSQISGALKEKEHGLFTYYLLKGMSGDADTNNDKKITLNELSEFVKRNVKQQAAIVGREQIPSLNNNSNLTFISFD